MEINYHLTEEDYLNFNMYHVKNSKTAMKSLNLQRILGSIFFIVFAYLFTIIAETENSGLLIVFIIVGVLWFIFYPKYFYAHVKRQTKKMIQEGKNGGLLGEHHLVMNKAGILETTSSGETKVSWAGLKKFAEDEDNFYLYNSGFSALILPKRDVTNEQEVRTYIQSKLKS